MMYDQRREQGMTATLSVAAPPEDRFRFGIATELAIGLFEWAPVPLHVADIHLHELAEIMAQPSQKEDKLPDRTEHARRRVGTVIRTAFPSRALKVVQHLQGDFERVPQQTVRLAVMMVRACGQVADEITQPRNDGHAYVKVIVFGQATQDLSDQVFAHRID